jgi:hypothetical protein
LKGHDVIREMYGGLFENSPQLVGQIANRMVVGTFGAYVEQIGGTNMPGMATSVEALCVYQVTGGKFSRVALYF